MGQNVLPLRRLVKQAEIRLDLACQYLEGCALSNSVRSDESKHLAGTRRGQTMQLERVLAISMRGLTVEILGQIDNLNGAKRTLFHANVAADAKLLADFSSLVFL